MYYKELSYELLVVQRGFILCEAKRNKRAGARYYEMRKSSCFLITKKPLLLEGRKSPYFWMTKEVSIFAKTPFSSVAREDVDTEEIITQEEYEFLKQSISRDTENQTFFSEFGPISVGSGSFI